MAKLNDGGSALGNASVGKEGKESFAESVKNKIFQFFESGGLWPILLFSVIGYLALVAYFFFFMPKEEIQRFSFEDSLVRTSELGIMPGEQYRYIYETSDVVGFFDYNITSAAWCPGVVVLESFGENASSFCITKEGTIYNETSVSGKKENAYLTLFSTWMLSLSDGFSWNAYSTYKAYGINTTISFNLKTKGKVNVAGREAYYVEASNSFEDSVSKFYVDAEKRVLLYAEDNLTRVILSRAPFELSWKNASGIFD